jgi:hypothetical protein
MAVAPRLAGVAGKVCSLLRADAGRFVSGLLVLASLPWLGLFAVLHVGAATMLSLAREKLSSRNATIDIFDVGMAALVVFVGLAAVAAVALVRRRGFPWGFVVAWVAAGLTTIPLLLMVVVADGIATAPSLNVR